MLCSRPCANPNRGSLFDLTTSARSGLLCSGAGWHAHRRVYRRWEASGMNRLLLTTSCAALAGAAAAGGYIGVVTGRLTVDLGIGRRIRPLGPLHVDIAAPRETVFAAAAAPYADRQPRAMREKVEILERAGQMVLAAHRTPVGSGLTAVTVETVTLDSPNRMGFPEAVWLDLHSTLLARMDFPCRNRTGRR